MVLSAWLTVATALAGVSAPKPQLSERNPDAQTIIQRSVEANQADWNAAPLYDHFERDVTPGDTKTYQILMIDGSPYRRLVRVNGHPLTREQQQEEQRKLAQATSQRRAESPAERASRIADWQRGRKRDQIMIEQLTKAFRFAMVGEGTSAGRRVYVLRATPRKDYQPPNRDAQVLTGMQGELWIDEQTFQWVKVKARVIHPVSIDGFLAEVEPGTYFELEKKPVGDGIWLPTHFEMKSQSRILGIFPHHEAQNETYFDYTRADRKERAAL